MLKYIIFILMRVLTIRCVVWCCAVCLIFWLLLKILYQICKRIKYQILKILTNMKSFIFSIDFYKIGNDILLKYLEPFFKILFLIVGCPLYFIVWVIVLLFEYSVHGVFLIVILFPIWYPISRLCL